MKRIKPKLTVEAAEKIKAMNTLNKTMQSISDLVKSNEEFNRKLVNLGLLAVKIPMKKPLE